MEGTQPSDDGQGYMQTPGIYTDAHVAGWNKVASQVHGAQGYLFIQLMHVGRMSQPDNTPHHRKPVAQVCNRAKRSNVWILQPGCRIFPFRES